MAGILRPVSIAGIEFDALIEETKTLTSTIPAYPVEYGFPVSDTIILNPLTVSMILYVSNTPVTWLYRHGSSRSRVQQVCDQIEALWMEKRTVKIVTSEAIYMDMGITSISIKKSRDIGYAREITLTAQKIKVTSQKAVDIPSYILKSGTTEARAGTASTSKTGKNASSGSDNAAGSVLTGGGGTSGGSGSGSGSWSKSGNASKKGASILYGVASGLKFI